MGRKILSIIFRYGLPLAAFVLILLISTGIQRYLGFGLDLTALIIILMIATAWYLGRGPGLLIAVVFEFVLDYFSPAPFTTKSAVILVNRMVLFVSLVWFASSRRNAEKKLNEQRELLQVTLSSIGDAVIATDVTGNVNFLNPVAESLTGWTVKEAAGKPIQEVFSIINEETRKPIESPFEAVIEAGSIVGLANHTVLIARDGREIPIEDSGAPIKDSDGKTIGVIVVFHDVSERRQAEKEREKLLKSEQEARGEAETAVRLKDEFLATVSHELRTPLNAILGWSAMLKNSNLERNNVRNALGIIERNAKAQAEIIGDILDVSRIITGKLQLDTKPVEIAPIIESAVDTLRPAATAKDISLTISLDNNNGYVIGDADRLQQIIWNLISNAIKFTSEKGKIEISSKRLDSFLEISISDNGIGIDEDFLPFIFERFRQGDASTTRMHGGLGLGLAIVRHLVELHGGTVYAESGGNGKGAIFTVRLPVAQGEPILSDGELYFDEDEASEFSADASDLRGTRVLIVDDDKDTLEVMRIVLKKHGAKVRIAVSTADALEVFREWRPDVLISDLGMPVEDGYSLISKIRALPPDQGGAIPAAALTAYVSEKDRQKALSAGYQIHIPKPIDPLKIVAAIAEMKKNE